MQLRVFGRGIQCRRGGENMLAVPPSSRASIQWPTKLKRICELSDQVEIEVDLQAVPFVGHMA